MAIKIIGSTERVEVETLKVTIYAEAGTGKTSFFYTAERPLLLAADPGFYRAVGRKDTIPIKTWNDAIEVSKDPSILANYQTIGFDTVGLLVEIAAQQICETSPKLVYLGALNQKGWGVLGQMMKSFFAAFSFVWAKTWF